MPILTTTYPLMNSTFNVSQHTQKLIQEKMLVAAEICDLVLDEKEEWEALFKVCQILFMLFSFGGRTQLGSWGPISKREYRKSYTR